MSMSCKQREQRACSGSEEVHRWWCLVLLSWPFQLLPTSFPLAKGRATPLEQLAPCCQSLQQFRPQPRSPSKRCFICAFAFALCLHSVRESNRTPSISMAASISPVIFLVLKKSAFCLSPWPPYTLHLSSISLRDNTGRTPARCHPILTRIRASLVTD